MSLNTRDNERRGQRDETHASALPATAEDHCWTRFLTVCRAEAPSELANLEGARRLSDARRNRVWALLDPARPWNRLRRFALWAYFGGAGPPAMYADAFEALAVLYCCGMPLADALLRSAYCWDNAAGRAFRDAAVRVRGGVALSTALAQADAELPLIVAPVLEVGERDGFQEAAIRRLAAALRYLVDVEHANDYALGVWLGRLLRRLLRWLVRLLGRVLPWQGWDRLLRVPAFSGKAPAANRSMATGLWGRTFAILWNCGVPISQALEIAAAASSSAFYSHALLQAACRTRAGWSLSASLADARLPHDVLDTVTTGETAGVLGPAVDRLANLKDDDGRETAGKTAAAAFFGGLLLMAAIVAALAIAASVALPHMR